MGRPVSHRALALNCDAPLNDKDGAESRNWRAGKPVRVVRSSKGRRISKYAPEEGNRYDGIYKVGQDLPRPWCLPSLPAGGCALKQTQWFSL